MRVTDFDYIQTIFRFLHKKLGVQEGHESFKCPSLEDQHHDVVFFMSSSKTAAIHLGQNYERNLETYKFTNFEQIENLLSITQNLVVGQSFRIFKCEDD